MNDESLQSAYLLKCMMDHMPDMIYFKDRDSRFIMMNQAAADWQGWSSPEEMVGHSDLDTYSEGDARRMREDELRIMETGEPLFGIEEPETWKNGSKAWVSTTKVPLRDENGEVIGIFGISRDITEHKEAEIRAAKFAEENARFRVEIEDDLLMASQLQKTFFPHSYPTFGKGGVDVQEPIRFFHLHHAGGVIGGDLCSIRKLSDTEAGIFLCDVMGHGVRAALGASIVRAVVEEISHQKKDPGEFLNHMNQVLLPLFRQDELFLFATACYMVLDVSTGSLHVANAGHPLPVLLDADSRSTRMLLDDSFVAGPALAIAENTEYETVKCRLQSGDGVFMYTDGITEAAGSRSEEYGQERLLDSVLQHINLPLSDLFSALYEDACRFTSSQSVEDDVCLVGFRLAL